MDDESYNRERRAGEARALLGLVWPLITTNLLNVSVGIADMKMVGMLGVRELAAVGVSRQVFILILGLMIAVTGGTTVLVSHAHGAKDKRRISQVAARSVVFMMFLALVVVMPLGFLFAGEVLGLLGAEPDVAAFGRLYLQILFGGAVFTMFNFAATGILLGVGLPRVSMTILVFENALNVLLNYLLIFGVGPVPALGVAGAAMGTVAARAVGSVAFFWALRSPRYGIRMQLGDGLQLDIALLAKILSLGGPRSLQGLVRNGSRLAIVKIIALLPDRTEALAAYNVGMQVRFISTFVGLAFMQATLSRVGRNLGAGRADLAEQSGDYGARLAAGIMAVAALTFVLFPNEIMGFFTGDAAVVRMGRTFFVIVALTEPIMGFAFAYSGALRGGGDALSPFIYASASDIIVTLGLGYILGVQFGMGIQGIAIAVAAGVVSRAVPCWYQFRRGDWKRNRFA